MRKSFITLFLIVIVSGGMTFGQSFDWNIRGGLNLMKSKTSDKDVSALYHFGAQAGIRISSFGFYGEALYSLLENQNTKGGDPVEYFAPSLIFKWYVKKFIFIELGGTLLSKTSESDVPDDLNPDGKVVMAGGLGAHFSKIELSLRSTVEQSYGLIQLTAAVKF